MTALVPEVKNALVHLLDNHAELADIDVSRSTPRDPSDHLNSRGAGEAIWVGRQGGQDGEGAGSPGPMIGGPLDPPEVFTVWLTVGVQHNHSDGSEESAQDRAWQIAEEVLVAVFEDPTLGITHATSRRAWKGVQTHEWAERNQALDQGWSCHVEIGLSCLVRRFPA